MSQPQIKKLYYSIGEVAELTALKPYVLRYWETEFPVLKPTKNRAGNRIYKDRDLKVIFHIKYLLYDQKYTIEGARNQLKSVNFEEMNEVGHPNLTLNKKEADESQDEDKLVKALSVVRTGLMEMKKMLQE